MLKILDCPSYELIQYGEQDVAMVPYAQFHTFMTDVLTNNREVQKANELFDKWREALILTNKTNAGEILMELYRDTLDYLGDLHVVEKRE